MKSSDPLEPVTLGDGSPSTCTAGVQQISWPSSRTPTKTPDSNIVNVQGPGMVNNQKSRT